MLNPNDTDIDNVGNLERTLETQIRKLNNLRKEVKKLRFVPIEPMGSYSSVTYKAIDGGRMKISFEPLEIDLIEVADSYGNLKLRFVLPKGTDESEMDDGRFLDADPIIRRFVNALGKSSITEISEILNQSDTFMELSEWACMFDRIVSAGDDPIILMRDGLLRTKKIKAELIPILWQVLKEKRKHVRLVGVSKTSSIVNLLSASLMIEHVFPPISNVRI